ncbi:MAG TPA: hypothetical protein DGF10_03370 [Acidimicrobiaceae bacterium]|nr:hypothetical protein [Acidimicrobiaceae bacterium]HAQ23505.1 hypothetical protein [Acidimicrobiaceae bacterium]HCV33683.1 hypothetical protein [Acidimicrobiaceae bacterium]
MIESVDGLRALVDQAESAGTAEARWRAVAAVSPKLVEDLLHGSVNVSANEAVQIATGVAASPGVASGRLCLDVNDVLDATDAGSESILVCIETSPADEAGMRLAAGIVTARGGIASHAAVVARGWGIPAVVGVEGLEVAENHAVVDGRRLERGDEVCLDGGTGFVYAGALTTATQDDVAELETLLAWADEVRGERVGVWANADRADDAAEARRFGAEGVGLCRTEHLFFGEHLPLIRRYLLSEDCDDESAALDDLEKVQRVDLTEVFRVMAPLPVTVRLLDAPLHEFLGDGVSAEWREHNPMLGTRGVRLAVIREGLYRMQVRAIMGAIADGEAKGIHPSVRVMVPLVATSAEMALVGGWVRDEIGKSAADILPVGMMVETPRAALLAGDMAHHADFFSFGTNDLTQMVYGLSRDDFGRRLMGEYFGRGLLTEDPFAHLDSQAVAPLVAAATRAGRMTQPGLEVSVCGEHGGDPASIQLLVDAGVDHVSCSPYRVPVARLSVAQALIGLDG